MGKFHGSGEMVYPNGNIFRGAFFYGKMSGDGEIIYSTGERLLCKMEDGKKTGIGKLFKLDGTTEDVIASTFRP